MLFIESVNKDSGSCSIGKLTLVDLAGSERVKKTNASGETLREVNSNDLFLCT